ncbi:LAQU0S06e05578g1_1 [Lachancea quebecensis]|uniref:LAQU0S06e05578g1_1 n=1 Tax=Lachancea quebecensis TaxID=1654605 RepID=A0A0P1KSP8_9SACH|nr:LAQU0S06e05578g1_1 [Lachancea quebecensis]
MLTRSLARPFRRGIVSCRPLYKNVPKFDDAELLADELNHGSYKAKRRRGDFEWADRSSQEMEKEYQDRMAKMMKLSAALQGLLIVAGLGAAATAYMKWPQIKGWWITRDMKLDDDAIEQIKRRKERKRALDFPIIPTTALPSSEPGLYFWGAGRNDGQNQRFPLRIPHFDHRKLRDVALSSVDGNLAINDKGDLISWDAKSMHMVLEGQNLVKVKASNGAAYALNKRGEILVVPLRDAAKRSDNVKWHRSWLLPWKKYCQYKWKLDTKNAFAGRSEKRVTDFDVGKDHLLFISNAGKAYVCATGITPPEKAKSRGQFGVPALSQFDRFPELNKVFEVELLNYGVGGDKVVTRTIQKVACGDYHSLALDSLGDVFSFGQNTHGQLGHPISYDMEYVPFPKKVGNFNAHFTRDTHLRCIDIHCGSNTSFVSVVPQDVHKYFRNKGKVSLEEELDKVTYFSFGNGIHGELGNGHFKHSQQEPTKLKVVNDLPESAEAKAPKRLKISEWSCGGEHFFCRLEDDEIVAWGSNDAGQLGNGKKIKTCKPTNIPKLLEPGTSRPEQLLDVSGFLHLAPEQHIVAGENSSCIYWKAV